LTPFVSLEPLIPGSGWKIAAPYHVPIEAGICIEQARLRGSSWLVIRHSEYRYYTDLWGDIHLGSGFRSEIEAIEHADIFRQQSLEELQRDRADWEMESSPPVWPAAEEINGRTIFRFQRFLLGHRYLNWPAYGDTCQLDVAVFPIDPEDPIDVTLIKAIGCDQELRSHFDKVGREA